MPRLIVNADDFGRTPAINQAVIQAHREGILTSASLMVNEPACEEAVTLARQHPQLGVGLHLTLIGGRAALPPHRVPGLVNAAGRFGDNPVALGCRYFFRRSLRSPLQAELAAQFEKFRATGLPLDHVNGHLHLHLQPVVFRLLLDNAAAWGVRHIRLTREPFGLNARLVRGRWGARAVQALIFHLLAAWCRPALRRHGIRHTCWVFGQLQTGRVDSQYVQQLLPRLPAGDSELYSHPALDEAPAELAALVSPRTKALVAEHQVRLIRYQDL